MGVRDIRSRHERRTFRIALCRSTRGVGDYQFRSRCDPRSTDYMTPPSMHQTTSGASDHFVPPQARAGSKVAMELPVSNATRVRVAIFNPIFAHYRSALIRELRRSTVADY